MKPYGLSRRDNLACGYGCCVTKYARICGKNPCDKGKKKAARRQMKLAADICQWPLKT